MHERQKLGCFNVQKHVNQKVFRNCQQITVICGVIKLFIQSIYSDH